MRLLLLLWVLSVPALADCPYSVPCPYDGEQMHNTWNCKGVGDTRACEFSHTKYVYENGQSKNVTHNVWAGCPS